MTALENIPALLIRVFVERVEITPNGPGEQGDVLADDGLRYAT